MADEDGRKSKVLYVLKILWEETDEDHMMTASDIAARLSDYGLSCGRRSIYRCLENLDEFGFDIIRTRAGVCIGSRIFETVELKLLLDAVQSSKFITVKKSSALITKMSQLSNVYEKNKLKGQIYISDRIKTMNESVFYNIDAIGEGISNDRKICFQYLNWNSDKNLVPRNGGRRYEVSPWCLIWERERYYLVAYDSNSCMMKNYRVDKMKRISLGETHREGYELYKKLDIPLYATENFGMFQGCKETVGLSASADMAGVIIDRFGREVWMHSGEDGMLNVVVDVAVSDQFFGWITAMGGKIKIISPEWVKQDYYKLLNRCIGDLED